MCQGAGAELINIIVTNPVLVLAAVLGMLFTATNTKLGTRNPGHHTIAL